LYGNTVRMYGKSEHMNILAQLVCSRVRGEIFRVLFGLHSGEMHLREIQRQTGFAIATVRQDIEKMVKLGLVKRRKDGNRVYYAADAMHPLNADIRQLVLKTVGLADILAQRLADAPIRCAFVFGSVADGTATAESDIDLMIIGDIGLRKASSLLSDLDNKLGREINPMVLTPAEFALRVREKDHFVTSILKAKKLFVVGSKDDLEAMAG
jgi:uncharacterized protein